MNEMDKGLIFTNLVEFDSKWGHRRDVDGYSRGLVDFDNRLPEIISNLRDDDLLIINADHGCDPTLREQITQENTFRFLCMEKKQKVE